MPDDTEKDTIFIVSSFYIAVGGTSTLASGSIGKHDVFWGLTEKEKIHFDVKGYLFKSTSFMIILKDPTNSGLFGFILNVFVYSSKVVNRPALSYKIGVNSV